MAVLMPQASPPRRVLATAVGTVGAMCGAVGGSASALFTTATSLLLVLLSYCIPLRRHSVKYCCNNDQKYLSDDEQTVPVIWLGVICVMGPLLTHVLYTVAFKEAPDQRDSEAFLHVQASLRQRHSMSQIAGGLIGARLLCTLNIYKEEFKLQPSEI